MNEGMQTLLAILGSGALSAVVAGIFNIINNRKGRLGEIEEELKQINQKLLRAEKDALRTQLLLMLSDYPNETQEILRLAEHYFKDKKGNWYATSLFNTWLIQRNIAQPDWFTPTDK